MSARFGWCSDNFHTTCPAVIERIYLDGNKVVHTGERRECGCACHRESEAV